MGFGPVLWIERLEDLVELLAEAHLQRLCGWSAVGGTA